MRKLLQFIVCCAALFPFAQVEAGAAGKLFGGFEPWKKFEFKVTKVISAQASLTDFDKSVPVPEGIPKFKKGQTVKFKIGRKGQLSGPGFLIPFKSGRKTANTYATVETSSRPKANVGIVSKIGTEPTGVALSFSKTTGSGFHTKVNSVNYTLE